MFSFLLLLFLFFCSFFLSLSLNFFNLALCLVHSTTKCAHTHIQGSTQREVSGVSNKKKKNEERNVLKGNEMRKRGKERQKETDRKRIITTQTLTLILTLTHSEQLETQRYEILLNDFFSTMPWLRWLCFNLLGG